MSEALEWRRVRLGDALEAKYGKSLPAAKRRGGTVPVYGSNGIVGLHDQALTSGPAIIIGRKGSLGEVNFSPVPCWAIDTTYFIDDPGPFEIKFLAHLLDSLGLTELDQSTAIPGLSRGRLYEIDLPVPPVAQQVQIVGLIDACRDHAIGAADHLAAARRAVERFRQAVLAAACRGQLTADWREERHLPATSDLLAKVRAKRHPATGGRTSVQRPNADELDELPTTWAWAAIGELADVRLGGTPSRQEASYWNGAVPWVSSGEVANCRISGTRETITEAGLENSSAKLYPAGTVLIAMIGEGKTRGQSAILDIEAATNQNAAGVLPDREAVSPEYLWRWALAQYEVTRAVGRGGNQPALNGQKVRELTIPVPPLEEQLEIVQRADQLLTLADQLQRRVDAAARKVESSSRAVLAKAFRGELAPTGGDLES